MQSFWRAITTGLTLTALACLAGHLLAGLTGLLAGLSIMLAAWLVLELYFIGKLAKWLTFPKSTTIPEAGGMWGSIFAVILKQARSRKKRKQKLTQSLQRFNHAAEAMPNGVLLLDSEGRITWMNRLASQHLNLDYQNDWNGILKNVIREPDFHQFLSQPANAHQELKLILPKYPLGERTLTIIRTQLGQQEEMLISHDISEAEQLNNMRTAFVANVSHELRTPLTVISGFLETMADLPDLPPEQNQKFIGLMQKEGKRMELLLADLLTLSRLESGIQADPQPINLSELAEILSSDAQNLSGGQHTINENIAPDLWMQGIYTDLYNGLSNIVFNAVRYTPEGGTITISLQTVPAETGPAELQFSVSDNGAGIPAEHLPHLTERFYRVDKGRSRESGGTGLGLAITKHALAEHNAVLHIESTLGEGSLFSTRFKQSTKPNSMPV